MESIRELYDLTQEIRPSPEAFDNSGHLLPSGTSTPKSVRRSGLARSFVIFDDSDFYFLISHEQVTKKGMEWKQ
jgi:hypothetical protein